SCLPADARAVPVVPRGNGGAIIRSVAELLLNLRGVPDDEADEIRALLAAHEIAFYETPPSRFGVSAGGIWVRDRGQAAAAGRLLAEYHARRQAAAQAEYRAAREAGAARTLWT